MKSSLEAAQALHLAYKQRINPDAAVINYIKSYIRTHNPEHLSAMIYFSALCNLRDNDLWNLFEMQVSRTNICTLMSLTSLIKACEGFSRFPGDFIEVFSTIQLNIYNKLKEEDSCKISDLTDCLFIFASLGIRNNDFYRNIHEKILKQREKLSAEQAVRILWSLSVLGVHGEILRVCVKVIESNGDQLQPAEKRQALWSIRFFN